MGGRGRRQQCDVREARYPAVVLVLVLVRVGSENAVWFVYSMG